MRHPGIAQASALAALLFLAVEAQGQQRIATVQNFTGEFEIEHSGQIIKPVKMGAILRNADVFDSDTVRTRKGQADLLVIDGSIVRMSENTTLYMAFEAPPPAAPGAPAAAPVDRKVRLVVGRIWCDIRPSRTSTTKFELPDGVAAVRGTIAEFHVPNNLSFDVGVDRGVLSLVHTTAGVEMSLAGGNKLGAQSVDANSVQFTNLGTGDVDLVLADGSRVSGFGPTDIVQVTRNPDGSYKVTMIKGSATFTDSTGRSSSVNEGQSATSQGVTGPGAGGVPGGGVPPGRGGGAAGGGGGGPTSPGSGTPNEQYPPHVQ